MWDGLRQGVDIVFTYGPLGFLSVPEPYLGASSLLALLATGAAYLGLVTALLVEARRILPLGLAALVVLVVAQPVRGARPIRSLPGTGVRRLRGGALGPDPPPPGGDRRDARGRSGGRGPRQDQRRHLRGGDGSGDSVDHRPALVAGACRVRGDGDRRHCWVCGWSGPATLGSPRLRTGSLRDRRRLFGSDGNGPRPGAALDLPGVRRQRGTRWLDCLAAGEPGWTRQRRLGLAALVALHRVRDVEDGLRPGVPGGLPSRRLSWRWSPSDAPASASGGLCDRVTPRRRRGLRRGVAKTTPAAYVDVVGSARSLINETVTAVMAGPGSRRAAANRARFRTRYVSGAGDRRWIVREDRLRSTPSRPAAAFAYPDDLVDRSRSSSPIQCLHALSGRAQCRAPPLCRRTGADPSRDRPEPGSRADWLTRPTSDTRCSPASRSL